MLTSRVPMRSTPRNSAALLSTATSPAATSPLTLVAALAGSSPEPSSSLVAELGDGVFVLVASCAEDGAAPGGVAVSSLFFGRYAALMSPMPTKNSSVRSETQ